MADMYQYNKLTSMNKNIKAKYYLAYYQTNMKTIFSTYKTFNEIASGGSEAPVGL
jgi:hypothetical protein